MTERTIRYSATSTFLESRAKYRLKYILKMEKVYEEREGFRPAFAWDTGNYGHAYLAEFYRGKPAAQCQEAADAYVAEANIDPNDDAVHNGAKAIAAYLAWLPESGADKGLEVVAVEERLFLPMGTFHGDNVTLTFEPDLIVKDRFRLVHILDHKFVAQFSSLAGFIGTNRQGLTYAMGLEAVQGITAVSFTLNQLQRKPPKKPDYIVADRVTQWITPDILARHRTYLERIIADMVQLHQEVESGDDSGAYPNPTYMCSRMCSDFDVCCGSITQEPAVVADILNTRYRRKEDTY